jgi:lipoprotein signal peptidase
LPALGVLAIVAVSVAIDRAVAHDAGTFHHTRPPLMVLPALFLVAYVWHVRGRCSKTAQAGIILCAGGAIANFTSLILDPSGVSDYIDVPAGSYLIVVNIADIALMSGLTIVAGSLVVRRLAARNVEAQTQ